MATAFRFKHGTYTTASGAARPVSMSVTPRQINTYQTSSLYDLQVELWFSASTPADFVTAIDGLIAALKVPRVDSGIQFTTDGSTWLNTSHFLLCQRLKLTDPFDVIIAATICSKPDIEVLWELNEQSKRLIDRNTSEIDDITGHQLDYFKEQRLLRPLLNEYLDWVRNRNQK